MKGKRRHEQETSFLRAQDEGIDNEGILSDFETLKKGNYYD